MTTERWALVPVEATPEMINSGYAVRPVGQFIPGFTARESVDYCEKHYGRQTLGNRYTAMLAESPGAALLAEVLAARDAFPGDPKGWDKRLVRLLAALDKLGPAAEGRREYQA